MKLEQRMQKVAMILSDVDGVLSDGGIYYDNQAIEIKKFHVRDGLGIRLWQKAGHKFGILTARTSHIVKVRAAELGLDIVRQGFENKLPVATEIIEELGISFDQLCVIGDDLTDLAIIEKAGVGVAVADAADEVKDVADMCTKTAGGMGAVRELVETLLKSQKRWEEITRQFYLVK